jgi:phage baseplate assembly protein W
MPAIDFDVAERRAHTLSLAETWLGMGPTFPFLPNRVGRLDYVSGQELVRQSIGIILDTEPGERIMLPTFGCGLRRYLMQPNSIATRAAMREDIVNALTQWEPRIRLRDVVVEPGDDPALVWIDIAYVLRVTESADNLVFPFYLQ